MTRAKVNWETITRDDFEAYEGVRVSGVTNMYAISTVADCSGLDKDDILAIMEHYSDLRKKYPGVRK